MGNEKVSDGQFRERVAEIVRSHLTAVYHCTRVWSAWNVGTMGQDDFEPADESSLSEDIAVEVAREFDALAAELATLRAENAALVADARRYRWLRGLSDANQFEVYDMAREPLLLHTEYLDAAIDAALARTLPTGENKEQGT